MVRLRPFSPTRSAARGMLAWYRPSQPRRGCSGRRPTPAFGIVASGRVALRLLVPERGTVTILTVEPGDIVGWSAIVPPYRATSTAVAVEPSRILTIDAITLRRSLRDDPALAATVYPRVLEAVARRMGATRHQLLDLYARESERQS